MRVRRPYASQAVSLVVAAVIVSTAASCGLEGDRGNRGAPAVGSETFSMHSSHNGSPPWPHVLTCYGGCEAPHYDPSACNHSTSCGPIANGRWWYSTERMAFGCGAKLKLERGGRCVVVDVQDNGPADWVEDRARSRCGVGYIIDTSPLVADYFGGGCGWGECFIVNVTPVPRDTPTGPEGCHTCDCTPGETQSRGCGWCGHQTRRCGGDCHWGGWGTCTGQGECAAGSRQDRDCCDCGSQHRTCSPGCRWGGWSGCAGPDPGGGNIVCDTGELGPCADGRVRCIAGCRTCRRIYEPVPEKCDDFDNDCTGIADDGSPTEMGDPPPRWAARLEDFSFPASLAPGAEGRVWVQFVNVGSREWPAGEVWLTPASALGGEPSLFFSPGLWPSWDVAVTFDADVAPGETGMAELTVRAPSAPAGAWEETFALVGPGGEPMRCPATTLDVKIDLAPAADDGREETKGFRPSGDPLVTGSGGCGCEICR